MLRSSVCAEIKSLEASFYHGFSSAAAPSLDQAVSVKLLCEAENKKNTHRPQSRLLSADVNLCVLPQHVDSSDTRVWTVGYCEHIIMKRYINPLTFNYVHLRHT